MDTKLLEVIRAYTRRVRWAVDELERAGLSRPPSNDAWAADKRIQRGTLPNGANFMKHGYGCLIRHAGGVVDFDFGAAGEIDGFDGWRLARFRDEAGIDGRAFADHREAEEAIQRALKKSEVVYSGYILHYLAPALRESP